MGQGMRDFGRLRSKRIGSMVEILEDRRLMAVSYLTGTENLSVSSKGEIATTSASLKQGAWYCVSVSGSVTLGKFANGSSRGVDAEYGQLYGSGDWATKSDRNNHYDWNLAFGQSSPSRVDWGAYNSSHSYSKVIQASADGQLKFNFLDECYGDNSGSFSVSVEPIDLRLQDVTFRSQQIKRDSGGAYSYVQWHDADRDGTITDSAPTYSNGTIDGSTEHVYPISFKRGTHLYACPSIPYSGTTGSNWMIRGSAAGYTFPASTAMAVAGSISASITATEALPMAIRSTEVDIDWELSVDGGSSFHSVGHSKNRLYVTGGDASGAYETALDIGCGAADGVNMRDDHLASDQRTAVDHIWGKYSGLSVKRVDGTPITYWGSHAGPGSTAHDLYDTPGLLRNADGRCGAWAEFYISVLGVQGICASKYDVNVRNSTVSLPDQSTDSPPATPLLGDVTFLWMGMKVSRPAQNTPTPQAYFRDHALVKVDVYPDAIYDPSYGGAFSGANAEQDWQDAAISGFCYVYEVRTASGSVTWAPGSLWVDHTNGDNNVY